MAADVADRAFEPFFTTKPRGVGRGLGLSTAYGIVTATGGSIRLYSEPGFGTTVKIDLPASTTSAQGERLDSAPIAENGHELVLLVEDEIAVRRASERILSEAGYKVLTAADGHEALRIASSDVRVDLLLTDVVMPEMLGPELAKRLLEDNPRLQVLYMSGYVPEIVQRHGFVARDSAMLEKPFTAQALLGAIRQAIDQPRSVV